MKRAVLLSMFGVLVFSCGAPPAVPDGGTDSGFVDDDAGVENPADAGASDAGFIDAGPQDAGLDDAGFDAGLDDAGLEDAGFDAGLDDAGLDDAGFDAGFDAGLEDAGFDAGLEDAGFDAGLADAGFDAGTWDGGVIPGCQPPLFNAPPFGLRVMAANLTSGNNQSYDLGHGARIMQGVNPDIVMIQEFNYGSNSTSDIQNFVSTTFPTFFYSRGTGQIPNGVISRWPIIDSGQWTDSQVSNRGFNWARVDVPGSVDLWVVSVHLLTSSAGVRNNEAQQLIARFTANIPPTDYLVLGGDFNTDTRSEACFSTFSSHLVTSGPHPVDQNGKEGTNASRSKPYDIVLASPCLAGRQTATVIGTSTYPSGLVVDTRVYTPLTEIAPAQFGDSSASNMQHMGVVKDFFIQP